MPKFTISLTKSITLYSTLTIEANSEREAWCQASGMISYRDPKEPWKKHPEIESLVWEETSDYESGDIDVNDIEES